MSWSEQQIRSAFLGSLGSAATDACPSAEVIWDTLQKRLPSTQRYAVVTHMSTCAHCAQVWQAAKLILEENDGASALDQAEPWWQRWLRPSVLAPALSGAFALVLAVVWMGPQEMPNLAPPVDSGVVRGGGGSLELLTPQQARVGVGQVLSWRTAGQAQHHQLILFAPVSGARIELSATGAEQVALPLEAAEAFTDGEEVQWYVVAIDGASPGAHSEVRSFIFVNN